MSNYVLNYAHNFFLFWSTDIKDCLILMNYFKAISSGTSIPTSSIRFCPVPDGMSSFAAGSGWISIPFTSTFSLFSPTSPSGRNNACRLFPSSILSNRLSLLFDAIRSVRHSLLARASVASCFSSSVFARSTSNSSSAIGPLKDSAVGNVYLADI